MKIKVEIQITDGQPNLWADGLPHSWEVECEISYSIDPGQTATSTQEGLAACVEQVDLISAKILYGIIEYQLTEESRWWDLIEEMFIEDENLQDKILDHDSNIQANGRW